MDRLHRIRTAEVSYGLVCLESLDIPPISTDAEPSTLIAQVQELASFNKIAEEYAARSGKEISITHRARTEIEEGIAKNPANFLSVLLLEWDKGNGTSGKPEEVANGEFPNWKPKKVVDFLLETWQ